MLLVADLTTWLQGQTWWPLDPTPANPNNPLAVGTPEDFAMTPGNKPDRCVFVFPTAGAGFLLEQAFDVPGAQLRFRGAQRDYTDAESMAKTIDKGLVTGWPTTIGGVDVGKIDRAGGAPAFLNRDPAGRVHFTGNYLFTSAY